MDRRGFLSALIAAAVAPLVPVPVPKPAKWRILEIDGHRIFEVRSSAGNICNAVAICLTNGTEVRVLIFDGHEIHRLGGIRVMASLSPDELKELAERSPAWEVMAA